MSPARFCSIQSEPALSCRLRPSPGHSLFDWTLLQQDVVVHSGHGPVILLLAHTHTHTQSRLSAPDCSVWVCQGARVHVYRARQLSVDVRLLHQKQPDVPVKLQRLLDQLQRGQGLRAGGGTGETGETGGGGEGRRQADGAPSSEGCACSSTAPPLGGSTEARTTG